MEGDDLNWDDLGPHLRPQAPVHHYFVPKVRTVEVSRCLGEQINGGWE